MYNVKITFLWLDPTPHNNNKAIHIRRFHPQIWRVCLLYIYHFLPASLGDSRRMFRSLNIARAEHSPTPNSQAGVTLFIKIRIFAKTEARRKINNKLKSVF